MSSENVFRKLYPGILNLTVDNIDQLPPGMSGVRETSLLIARDLEKARAKQIPEGWGYRYNPFIALEFSEPQPPDFTDVMEVQHRMTAFGHAWFSIAMWTLAEDYYKLAISLAHFSNDAIAALQNGANLAICYLGAGCLSDALRLSEHLLEAATVATDCYCSEYIPRQAHTIIRMCVFADGNSSEVQVLTRSLQKHHPKWALLDDHVDDTLRSTYQAIGDKSKLRQWISDWQSLQRLVELASLHQKGEQRTTKVIQVTYSNVALFGTDEVDNRILDNLREDFESGLRQAIGRSYPDAKVHIICGTSCHVVVQGNLSNEDTLKVRGILDEHLGRFDWLPKPVPSPSFAGETNDDLPSEGGDQKGKP